MLELCDMDINITVTNMPQEYNGNVVDINGNLETMKEILELKIVVTIFIILHLCLIAGDRISKSEDKSK